MSDIIAIADIIADKSIINLLLCLNIHQIIQAIELVASNNIIISSLQITQSPQNL